jgi:hypothetical protein
LRDALDDERRKSSMGSATMEDAAIEEAERELKASGESSDSANNVERLTRAIAIARRAEDSLLAQITSGAVALSPGLFDRTHQEPTKPLLQAPRGSTSRPKPAERPVLRTGALTPPTPTTGMMPSQRTPPAASQRSASVDKARQRPSSSGPSSSTAATAHAVSTPPLRVTATTQSLAQTPSIKPKSAPSPAASSRSKLPPASAPAAAPTSSSRSQKTGPSPASTARSGKASGAATSKSAVARQKAAANQKAREVGGGGPSTSAGADLSITSAPASEPLGSLAEADEEQGSPPAVMAAVLPWTATSHLTMSPAAAPSVAEPLVARRPSAGRGHSQAGDSRGQQAGWLSWLGSPADGK